MVKVGGGLSRPIQVQRGIRQGCLLSGKLYSVAIEPLLCELRNKLKGFHLPNSSDNMPLTVSAYADDVNIFVTDQADVCTLEDCFGLYQ